VSGKDPLRRGARRIAAWMGRTRVARGPLRRLALRGFVPTVVWRHVPPGDPHFVIELPSGRSFRYTVELNDPFVRELYWRGLESDEAASLTIFGELAVGGGLLVDVGAHTGLYTVAALAASDDTRVIAFEPVPANLDRLRQNLELNGWTGRCAIRPAAVSDTVGRARLHVPLDDHPMSASLHSGGYRGLPGRVIEVDTTTLDHELRGEAPRAMKIDVEGFEDAVLRGATHVLSQTRPSILIECNVDGPIKEVETILRAAHYRFRLLDGTERQPLDRLEIDRTERFRNTLCVPT